MNDKNKSGKRSNSPNMKNAAGLKKPKRLKSASLNVNKTSKESNLRPGDVVSTPIGAGILKIQNPIVSIVRIRNKDRKLLSGSITAL